MLFITELWTDRWQKQYSQWRHFETVSEVCAILRVGFGTRPSSKTNSFSNKKASAAESKRMQVLFLMWNCLVCNTF